GVRPQEPRTRVHPALPGATVARFPRVVDSNVPAAARELRLFRRVVPRLARIGASLEPHLEPRVTPRRPLSVLHALAGYREPPHGGSVLYPLAIAAAQSRTCRVALFAADVDPLATPYRVLDGDIGGVTSRRVAK